MRLSKTGCAVALLYLVLSTALITLALSHSGDHKGSFVLLQLPLALQLAALHEIGVPLSGLSFVSGYLLITPPTLLVLYAAGWGAERVVIGLWGQAKACLERLLRRAGDKP